MTAIKPIDKLVNNANFLFHGQVDQTKPAPAPEPTPTPTSERPSTQEVSLYGECMGIGCERTDVYRGTNCKTCGWYRPER